jgi:uncharacterized protein (TIGR03032 family)
LPESLRFFEGRAADTQFVLLDYNSPDGLGEWIRQEPVTSRAIASGLLLYVREQNAKTYICPKAKNLAHRMASGDVLVNLDADNWVADIDAGVRETFASGARVVLHARNKDHDGTYGRIGLTREWFHRLGGYDESFEPMGYQDDDLLNRAVAAGLAKFSLACGRLPVRNEWWHKIEMTGTSRSWTEMLMANKAKSDEKLARGEIVRNLQGWGAAEISINFGHVQKLPPLVPEPVALTPRKSSTSASARPAAHPVHSDGRRSVSASPGFTEWLARARISLALTSSRVGKLLLLGVDALGRLSVFDRVFDRCTGLCPGVDETSKSADSRTLWMATPYQIWCLEDVFDTGEEHEGYDRLYVPRLGHTTGDLDVHDIAVESRGRLLFVNTLCSCIATVSRRKNFTPLWHPPAISKIVAEDRCHLTGLALENGTAAYVTACSTTDVGDGWREHRRDGGLIIDVRTNETVAAGLSMPHSPRVHGETLYVHDSGRGQFGRVDQSSGRFEPIRFCPGYLRGLAFHESYALVGLSRPRERSFIGLMLDDELARYGQSPHCGIHVIDLRSGEVVHWLHFDESIGEVYDLVVLANVRKPMAFGFKTGEIRRTVTMDSPMKL